jgi:hypothetical protein
MWAEKISFRMIKLFKITPAFSRFLNSHAVFLEER